MSDTKPCACAPGCGNERADGGSFCRTCRAAWLTTDNCRRAQANFETRAWVFRANLADWARTRSAELWSAKMATWPQLQAEPIDGSKAKGGSPACPACGKHSPTFPHPLGPGWFRCQKGCDINFPEMKP